MASLVGGVHGVPRLFLTWARFEKCKYTERSLIVSYKKVSCSFPCISVLLGPHYHFPIATFYGSLPSHRTSLHQEAYSQNVNRWKDAEGRLVFEFVIIFLASVFDMVRFSLFLGFAFGWCARSTETFFDMGTIRKM
jgi:hypothetical protein